MIELKSCIEEYLPCCEQEEKDRLQMLWLLNEYPDTIFTRENTLFHFVASGFILNEARNKTLMVYHNLYQSWSWTGGHADGEKDLLRVAMREAREETGLKYVVPLSEKIASLDILTVQGHRKRESYVGAHLHLSVGFVLAAREDAPIFINPQENSGVQWIPLKDLEKTVREKWMLPVYKKLIQRVEKII